ncbi:hypothetical protein EON62_04235, partial [archaeon]
MRAWLLEPAAGRRGGTSTLLPSPTAKLVFCLRGLIVMAALSVWMLHPSTATLLQGVILVPVSAIVCIQTTVGGTIFVAERIIAAVFVAVAYNAVVVSILPRSAIAGIAALGVASMFVNYMDLTTSTKRMSLAVIVVSLLQWQESHLFRLITALEIGASTAIGCAGGVLVSMLPLPRFATAGREVALRLFMHAAAFRNEAAALAIAFTHEAVLQYGYTSHIAQQLLNDMSTELSTALLDGVTDPTVSAVEDRMTPRSVPDSPAVTLAMGTPQPASASCVGVGAQAVGAPASPADGLRLRRQGSLHMEHLDLEPVEEVAAELTGERIPLLRTDIEDMIGYSEQHLPALTRALSEVKSERAWSPSYVLLSHLPTRISCIANALHRARSRHAVMSAWTTAARKLHRITQSMAVSERAVRTCILHLGFAKHMSSPLCNLIIAITTYHETAMAFSLAGKTASVEDSM